jgi:subtilisin family serine protease
MNGKRVWFLLVVLALVLATFSPAGAASPAPLYAADGLDVISGRYIVVFKGGVSTRSVDSAANLAKGLGGQVHFSYRAVLNGFAATLPAAALEGLRRNPNVAYVEADQVITIDTTQSPATWGIDRIDQRNRPLSNTFTYSNTGAGVRAYIIDTGLLTSHNEFDGRASIGADTVGDGRNGVDCNGHGTHVAGTVGGATYGVAKGVSLIGVRVLNCNGSGTTSGVIAGVDWVTSHAVKPAVANMSLGGGASTALDSAVNNSINSGVTYAIAAGNSNRDACRFSPARVAAAITVGATTSSDARASYSNWGACLDLFAPGSSITSAWYSSNTAINTISGTSMATPHTAGVAALYLQSNPTASPATVASALTSNATTGLVTNARTGSPNRLLFTNY